jgi:hypothetical protein
MTFALDDVKKQTLVERAFRDVRFAPKADIWRAAH